MKRIIAFIVAAACCLGLASFSAAAARYDATDKRFSLELPDSFTVLDHDNLKEHKEFIEKLGSSVENFGKSMKAANIYMYAATEDNQRQAQVKVWESSFSADIGNLAALNDEQFDTVEQKLRESVVADGGELVNVSVVSGSKTKFVHYVVRITDSVESESGETLSYCMSQHLTVADGKFVALVYYNSQGDFTAEEKAESDQIFSSFSVSVGKSGSSQQWYLLLFRILAALLIIAAAAGIIFIVISFAKDIKAHYDNPETIPKHIKMRRKK